MMSAIVDGTCGFVAPFYREVIGWTDRYQLYELLADGGPMVDLVDLPDLPALP